MYHTLKTLYNTTQKHNPQLVAQFKFLKYYCYDADEFYHAVNINMSYNSLKWFIYTLRDNITDKELQDAFYFALAECQNDEMRLYDSIASTKIYFKYKKYFRKNNVDLSKHEIREVHEWKVLINRTTENITAITFKRKIADIIIFRNPTNFATGIIFNQKDTAITNCFNIPLIFLSLNKLEPGGWKMIGQNLIIKGGPKAAGKENSVSKVTAEQVYTILQENVKRK